MNFIDMGRSGLLVKHVDVLRRDALEAVDILKVLERAMDRSWPEAAESVDEVGASAIVDGRVAVEPVDIKDALGVRMAVKPIRSPEIGDAAERRNARAREAAHLPRISNGLNEPSHCIVVFHGKIIA